MSKAKIAGCTVALVSAALLTFLGLWEGGNQYTVYADKLGYVFDYLAGSSGAFYSKTVNAGIKVAQGRELDDREIPFLRKVSGNVTWYEGQSDLYERKDQIAQAENEWKSLRGAERIAFYKEKGAEIRRNQSWKPQRSTSSC